MTQSHRRIAIIGAGPSGIFAAQALIAQDRLPVTIDMYDRLPTPYGLVRYGVAPDHATIKTVTRALSKVFDSPQVHFYGMVEFGRDITRAEVRAAYDAVIYAHGVGDDVALGVPGEELPGCVAARDFVNWYNGHPDAQPMELAGIRSVVVAGLGNVALDAARMLLRHPDEIARTDVPESVLARLREHQVTDVYVVGRRGLQHAAFTSPELREMLAIQGLAVTVSEGGFDGIDPDGLDRRTRTNVEALQQAASREVADPRVRLHFLFWHRPVEVHGDARLSSVTLERTMLDENRRVVGTGDYLTLPTDYMVKAIGYRGVALPEVPFDSTAGVTRNRDGRVCEDDDQLAAGEYVVGWAKRGPIGVIGSNKSDASATVGHVIDDLMDAPPPPDHGESSPLLSLLAQRGVTPSTLADWMNIEEAEIRRGVSRGCERVKLSTWEELRAEVGRSVSGAAGSGVHLPPTVDLSRTGTTEPKSV